MSACCPSGSWPQLSSDYKCKGEEHVVDDLKLYVAMGQTKEKCIIWNYDIYGFEGGRTRQLVDALADKGFMVILPDYYRGEWVDVADPNLFSFIKKRTVWSELKSDYELKIRPFALNQGAKVFGAVGTCWGSYNVVKLSAEFPEDFRAGVSFHPSHSPIMGVLEENEEEVMKAIKEKNKAKQLLCPANDDHDNVKPNGLDSKILGEDLLQIIEFDDMKHGWTTRGDINDGKVARDVTKALDEAYNFFSKNL